MWALCRAFVCNMQYLHLLRFVGAPGSTTAAQPTAQSQGYADTWQPESTVCCVYTFLTSFRGCLINCRILAIVFSFSNKSKDRLRPEASALFVHCSNGYLSEPPYSIIFCISWTSSWVPPLSCTTYDVFNGAHVRCACRTRYSFMNSWIPFDADRSYRKWYRSINRSTSPLDTRGLCSILIRACATTNQFLAIGLCHVKCKPPLQHCGPACMLNLAPLVTSPAKGGCHIVAWTHIPTTHVWKPY